MDSNARRHLRSLRRRVELLVESVQIAGVLAAQLSHPHTGSRQVCRCWRQLDLDELKHDI